MNTQTKVTEVIEADVNSLKINKKYQREIRRSELFKIKKQMEEFGFYPWSPILVSESTNNVINGQHRLAVAKELGYKTVPVRVLPCKNEAEEIEWFARLNDENTRLAPIDAWNAKYLVGHLTARLIYFLNESEKSLLFNRILIKGHSTSTRFTIAQVITIAGAAAFDTHVTWCSSKDMLISRMFAKESFGCIMLRVNHFMKWFFDCFGADKNRNPFPYRNESIRAIALFYIRLKATGYFSKVHEGTKEYATGIKKMRKFVFPQTWSVFSLQTQAALISHHWNKEKTNFIVPIAIDETFDLKD